MTMAKKEGDYDDTETCDAADSSRVDAEVARTSLRLFFERNPKRDAIKTARDAKGGIWKVIDVAIFGFVLFAPALPIIPKMSIPAIVIVLWVLIGLIMLFKIEYTHRAQVWYTCLNRGIIVDFPKTDTAAGWLCQVPVLVAVKFLFIFGFVTYIGLDPSFKFPEVSYLATAVLSIFGLTFVLTLTKGFVDLEGANHLLTLNLVIHYFEDRELFQAKRLVMHSCTLLPDCLKGYS
eukprot:TRINITY_DN105137_c0_g1_i1.p1 TRINITY_DN105137_c0_g1~~TRINITY_DN105137_c0_g1_i1.p1  ORF type:complete len:234 (+),score=30.07 TRINITY_DN105137_c0_g1_i1:71-772(+)